MRFGPERNHFLYSKIGQMVVTNMIISYVIIATVGYFMSNSVVFYSNAITPGNWIIVTVSSGLALFVTACMSATFDSLLVVTSILDEDTSEIAATKFFFAFQIATSIFGLFSSIALLVFIADLSRTVSSVSSLERSAIAGASFGIFSTISRGIAAIIGRNINVNY